MLSPFAVVAVMRTVVDTVPALTLIDAYPLASVFATGVVSPCGMVRYRPPCVVLSVKPTALPAIGAPVLPTT